MVRVISEHGAPVVPHLSVAERVARGKAARAEVPRSRHAEFDSAAFRADPLELLEQQAATRVPELVPIRYGRMLVSPFTFFRGAALVMAADLAASPTPGCGSQLCGDAHLANFGVFGSPDRRLLFDLNDFDETLPGPVGVGCQAAGRQHGGGWPRERYSQRQRARVVADAVAAYRRAMRDFAAMPNLAVWYARFDIEAELGRLRKRFGREDGASGSSGTWPRRAPATATTRWRSSPMRSTASRGSSAIRQSWCRWKSCSRPWRPTRSPRP